MSDFPEHAQFRPTVSAHRPAPPSRELPRGAALALAAVYMLLGGLTGLLLWAFGAPGWLALLAWLVLPGAALMVTLATALASPCHARVDRQEPRHV